MIISNQNLMTDIVKILIADGAHLPLRHLSIKGCVSEETLIQVISGQVFQKLEILTINHKYLTTNIKRLNKFFKCNIKKLNLKGCAVSLMNRLNDMTGHDLSNKKFAEDCNFVGDGYSKFCSERDLYGM